MAYDFNRMRGEGKRFQQQAAWAYQLGEYRTAFDLYVRAEECFRRGYPCPGDRVYFMQNWQLTCLEKLAETDPDAYRSYRQKSEEFLKEWPEEVIRARISPDRQYEAIGF